MSSVLVTGASRGLGRAIALELTRRGHRVIATARNVDALADLPVDARLPLDVTDQASVTSAIAEAGDIDVLVSNAGATLRAPVESVPLAEVERLFQLNTLGALRVTQAVLPAMRARGSGRIVYVSTMAAAVPFPLNSAYAASKRALEAFAEALAIEVREFGITVGILRPGGISTGAADRAPVYVAEDDPYRPLLRELAAAHRDPDTAEDVARAVVDAVENPTADLRIPVGAVARGPLG